MKRGIVEDALVAALERRPWARKVIALQAGLWFRLRLWRADRRLITTSIRIPGTSRHLVVIADPLPEARLVPPRRRP